MFAVVAYIFPRNEICVHNYKVLVNNLVGESKGVEPSQVGAMHRFSHSEYNSGNSLRYKNPVCLHALGFLLLASSIPRAMIHCLLPSTNS